jgi:hypothetical protein
MAYTLSPAGNAMAIGEREYANAAAIQFTTFTSCIGVIANKGATLTAVHLVMTDGTSKFRSLEAVDVHTIIGTATQVSIIGCVGLWRNQENGVRIGFEKLVSKYQNLGIVNLYPLASGTYGAQINAGNIELTF